MVERSFRSGAEKFQLGAAGDPACLRQLREAALVLQICISRAKGKRLGLDAWKITGAG